MVYVRGVLSAISATGRMLPLTPLTWISSNSVMNLGQSSPGVLVKGGRKMHTMANENTIKLNQSNVGSILDNYDTLLLDCDGVLWHSDHYTKFEGTPKAIDKLRKLNKNLLFVTNNSLHARSAYVDKFKDFAGFEASIEDVFGVAYAAVSYLKNIVKVKKRCYLIGSKGMAEELTLAEIDFFGFGPDNEKVSIHPDDILNLTYHDDIDSVLVGFDEFFNYAKLTKACSYLTDPKCHYVATNDMERWIQLTETCRQPLTGAIVSAVTSGSNREPIVVGKPYSHLLSCIQSQKPGLDLSRTLMVGDSLKTDIGFAKNSGIASLLVLSGVTNEERFQKEKGRNDGNIPTYVMDSFVDFGDIL